MNKLLKNAYIDQYGQIFYADTVKELKNKIGRTKAHKMYHNFQGKTYHVGYVIGGHWLYAYVPMMKEC